MSVCALLFTNSLSLSKDFFRLQVLPSKRGRRNPMALALESMIAPLTGVPERAFSEESDSKLNISVVFTSVKATLGALKEAGNLAKSLGGRITLIVPQIVPYPLPLTRPPVP